MIAPRYKLATLALLCFAVVVGLLSCTYQGNAPVRTSSPEQIREVKTRIKAHPLARIGDLLRVSSGEGAPKFGQYALWIFTSPDCVHCVRSLPFHRDLLRAAQSDRRQSTARLRIVVPNARRDAQLLGPESEVVQFSLGWEQVNLKPPGTPCVYLTDPAGRIVREWPGQLGASGEAEVRAALNDPPAAAAAAQTVRLPGALTREEVTLLKTSTPVTVLSVLDRKSFRPDPLGTINIPLDELAARAPAELDRKSALVADCTGVPAPICLATVNALRDQGYRAFPMEPVAGVMLRQEPAR